MIKRKEIFDGFPWPYGTPWPDIKTEDFFKESIFTQEKKKSTYPPYNMITTDTGAVIELAVAGFTRDNLEVTVS